MEGDLRTLSTYNSLGYVNLQTIYSVRYSYGKIMLTGNREALTV